MNKVQAQAASAPPKDQEQAGKPADDEGAA